MRSAKQSEAHDSEAKADGTRASPEDFALVERLLKRDEAAFETLVRRYHLTMIRVVDGILRNRAVAEEVVQETWQAVLERLPAFEGRSSLKTWIMRILLYRARTRAVRENRLSTSALTNEFSNEDVELEPVASIATWNHRAPSTPEGKLLTAELGEIIERAIADLPEGPRLVLTLRDVHGWSSLEVCATLGVTDANQRVMLHRARSTVRRSLRQYFGDAAEHELSVCSALGGEIESGSESRTVQPDGSDRTSTSLPRVSRAGR